MPLHLRYLPAAVTTFICAALLIYGPIAQFDNYHAFADQATWFALPHPGDVLSNLGFAAVALWGMLRLWPQRRQPHLRAGSHGYGLFLVALLLTAVGSGYYHLAPDNARLVWDRLPIALACAGLLAAVRAETVGVETAGPAHGGREALLLGLLSVLGVVWWRVTDLQGRGDLRLYLLFQILPLVLIPLWQAIYRAPLCDRRAFAAAILFYVLAKFAEIHDHQLFVLLHYVSGHTLKHVLATVAAAFLVANLVRRGRSHARADQRVGPTSCCS